MSAKEARSSVEYWREMPGFYRELIDRYGWKQRPMLDLVERLSESPWAERIYPSTSHEALGLSLHEHYEQRRTSPMVYIQYDGERDTFEISYQRGQGNTVSSELQTQVDDTVWERVVAWATGTAV